MRRNALGGKRYAPSHNPTNPPMPTARSHSGKWDGRAGIVDETPARAEAELSRLNAAETAPDWRVLTQPSERTSGARKILPPTPV